MRTTIKRSLTRCAERLPPASGSNRRVVVLCYHSIHPSKGFASVSPALFEEHLIWLREHAEILSFEEAITAARQTASRRPAVAITFDDGYADNYEYAFPILNRHATTADFFVTVGLLERSRSVLDRFMRERSVPREEIEPLDWSAVDEMQRAGMRFGSHTWGHTNLARADDVAAASELCRSKDRLEERLGQPVSSLAYPYGKPKRHVTSRIVNLAGRAGYRHAAAVTFRGVRADDDPLCIPRFFVTRDSIPSLASKVLGRLDILGRWQERGPAWAGRLISPEDFIR